jgi:hypothetical protein
MLKSWINTLFLPTKNPSSVGAILKWWELRRIPFNMLVGAVGIVSFILNLWLYITYLPDESAGSPALSAVFFGIMANIFYTGGWIAEVTLRVIRKRGSKTIGPRLFKLGLCFSLILASLPGLVLALQVATKKLHPN